MSRQRSSRLERRAEREARAPGSAPRARRQRQSRGSGGGGGRNFLPGFLGKISGTALAIGIGMIVVVAGLVYAVTQTGSDTASAAWNEAQLNDDPNLPGVYYPPHPGADGEFGTTDDREHFATGTVIPICTQAQLDSGNVSDPLCYTSNPPASGPHADRPITFSEVLTSPAPKENLIHSMEHGGVIIWYNTDDQDVIGKLDALVKEQQDRRRFVQVTQYDGMEPDTIAVTAWTRLDKFPVSEYDKKRIEDFIGEHHKRFNPEGF